jgi:hypothetical protein
VAFGNPSYKPVVVDVCRIPLHDPLKVFAAVLAVNVQLLLIFTVPSLHVLLRSTTGAHQVFKIVNETFI